jgi:hypothetical protein
MSTGFKRLVEKIHAIDQEIQLGKDADWIKQEIEDVCRQLDPFCKKAEIVDPENRIYSDSMIQRIKEAKIHADRVLEKALEYWEKAQIVKEQERQELQRKLDLLEKERVERETKEREAQRIAEELKAKAEEEKRIRDQMIREKEEEEKRIRDKWQREKYETERDIREQRKKAEKLEMLERERRIEEAKSSSVQDIAEKLVDWNPDDDEIPIMMFRTLLNIVSNILAAPENPQFRHIRIENEHIQRTFFYYSRKELFKILKFRRFDESFGWN